MVSEFLDALLGFLKNRPYWHRIEPFVSFAVLYVTTTVIAYEFVQWRYGLTPAPGLFVRSYIFKQITVLFVALLVAGITFFLFTSQRPVGTWRLTGTQLRVATRFAIAVALIVAVFVPTFLSFSPNRVSHIRVKFLKEPGQEFDKYAFAYLLYELNKLQRQWYFEVDFDVFNPDAMSADEQARCERPPFCYAEHAARGEPLIGITFEPLGDDFFWRNEGNVSVISTDGWNPPPSAYRFLAYSVVLQSIMIHLNGNCEGLPQGAGRETRVGVGDLFGFSPRRQAMKAQILAAHLSPSGEELLLNCFGAAYMSTGTRLLALDWARTPSVTENLDKTYGVKF